MKMTEKETLENFVRFDIYFRDISYTKHTQSKKIDEAAVISDIGKAIFCETGRWTKVH